MNVKVFGREPAAIVGAIQGVLALLIGFGALEFIGLSTQVDLGIVMAVVSGVAALYLAYVTSETLLAPVIEVIKAGVALGAVYGLNVSTEQTALLIGAATTLLALYQRDRVAPLNRPSFEVIAPDDTTTQTVGTIVNVSADYGSGYGYGQDELDDDDELDFEDGPDDTPLTDADLGAPHGTVSGNQFSTNPVAFPAHTRPDAPLVAEDPFEGRPGNAHA